MQSPASQHARAWAANGYAPLAIRPNAKVPMQSGWQTRSVDEVTAALEATPGANLGVAIPRGFVVLDIDARHNGFDSLANLETQYAPLPATLSQSTPGGEHRFFRLPAGVALGNSVERLGAGLDTRGEGGYIVTEPSMRDGKTYSLIDFDLLAGEVPQFATAPGWLVDLLRKPAEQKPVHEAGGKIIEGGRNATLFHKGCTMRGQGFSADEINAALQSYNSRNCVPPLPCDEVARTAASAAKYEPNADHHVAAATSIANGYLVSVGDLTDDIKPPSWLVRLFLEADTVIMLYGAPGAGKSFLAIGWACCVATGTAWNGKPVKQGPVVYIAGEGQNGIRRRFRAWELANGVSLKGSPLFMSIKAAQFLDTRNAEAVSNEVANECEKIGEHPRLIVIDTLARNFGGGDENSTEDMTKFVNVVDELRARFKCSVLIVHHSGKDKKAGSRGSSVLLAAVDASYVIEDDDGIRTLKNEKMKDGEPPADMPFSLKSVDLGIVDDQGEPVTSAVLEHIDITPMLKLTGKGGRLRDYLKRAIEKAGCREREIIRDAFDSIYPAKGDEHKQKDAKRQAFNRAWKEHAEELLAAWTDTDKS